MSTSSLLTAIIILVLIGVGAWWIIGRQTTTTPTDTSEPTTSPPVTTPPTTTSSCPGAASLPKTVTISYQVNAFSSSDAGVALASEKFCVPKGGTVTFMGSDLWVASDPHPIHTDLSGFDAKGAKESYSFTFDKVGEWGFHNHLRATDTGTIIVVQ